MAVAGRLALYTTVYPKVEKYLSAWYRSVETQTDLEFDIWIGVDGLDTNTVVAKMGADPPVHWVPAVTGDTPTQIRQKAMEQMVTEYPAVVFVDSDDLLEPTRIEAARRALEQCDLYGCAMRIIGVDGEDMEACFSIPEQVAIEKILLRNNIFGLSNTAYRSELLRRCLPLPAGCVLVDWFLATRSWILGANLHFDTTCRMAYRQYSHNIARVLPPFTPQQVLVATERVLDHYKVVLSNIPELQTQHKAQLETVRSSVAEFFRSIKVSADILMRYVQALNRLPSNHVWWSCVAHPDLEAIWKN